MAFTKQGVAMLSSVLGSPRAIAVNAELAKRLAVVEAKLDQHRAEFGKAAGDTSRTLAEHEKHIRIVFETIRRLMAEDEPTPPARVGFKLH